MEWTLSYIISYSLPSSLQISSSFNGKEFNIALIILLLKYNCQIFAKYLEILNIILNNFYSSHRCWLIHPSPFYHPKY